VVGVRLILSDPEFVIFTGPMFGSKTTRLMAAVDRYRYQQRNIIAFKPRMDNRYSDLEICTHSGGKLPAVGVSSGDDVLQYLNDAKIDYDVVAIDEAFMIDGIAKIALNLFREGKTIIVSSLQLSASGNVFEEVRDMMPWATKIQICPAVCPITGRDAYYTHRKVSGLEEIVVGGSDLYEPRCWEYHTYMNCRE
jgi:thymidine kinase